MQQRDFQQFHDCSSALIDLENCDHFVVFIASPVSRLCSCSIHQGSAREGLAQRSSEREITKSIHVSKIARGAVKPTG